jgi:cation-transporting ATPase E
LPTLSLLPSVDPARSVAVISLSVYQFFLTMTENTMWAQAAVTTTMVACGLLIVLFAQPPSPAWVGGSSLNGDRRPAAMVVGLFCIYLAVLAIEPARTFFEVTTLPFSGYVMIGFVVAGWAIIVRTLWRWALGRKVILMWRRRYPHGFSIGSESAEPEVPESETVTERS